MLEPIRPFEQFSGDNRDGRLVVGCDCLQLAFLPEKFPISKEGKKSTMDFVRRVKASTFYSSH